MLGFIVAKVLILIVVEDSLVLTKAKLTTLEKSGS